MRNWLKREREREGEREGGSYYKLRINTTVASMSIIEMPNNIFHSYLASTSKYFNMCLQYRHHSLFQTKNQDA